jgi:hypothetical protein
MSDKAKAAVVVPVYRMPLAEDENISLRHLRRHLSSFDCFRIGPNIATKGFEDFRFQAFPARYFQGRSGYNRLLLSKEFYRAFKAYEFILIYQLDCLVFAGNLDFWCRQDWDYTGAPWFRGCKGDAREGFWAVGNGGLSLRKVSSAIRVLESKALTVNPSILGQRTRWFESWPFARRIACRVKTRLHECGYKNDVRWKVAEYGHDFTHEDVFWSFDAQRYVPEFRIPPPLTAVSFAFEAAPRYCYEANGRQLPFGCHAWTKHDRQFWEPFLLG